MEGKVGNYCGSSNLRSRRNSSVSFSSSTSIFKLAKMALVVEAFLLSSCIINMAETKPSTNYDHEQGLVKRSAGVLPAGCLGVANWDGVLFNRLDRVCEDCYNLFRDPKIYVQCRDQCFTSVYFKGCVDVLLLQDEIPKYKKWIIQLHGIPPN